MVGEKEWETCYHSTPAGYITGCRRAASFPFFGDHSLVPSSALKPPMQLEAGVTMNEQPLSDEASDCESDSSSSTSEEPDASSGAAVEQMVEVPSKAQKSVRFADDCGKELYSVRVMTEPSDYPPQINPNVLRKLRGDDYVEESLNKDPSPTWNLLFKQPASEYVRFRETLEKDRVSLENVVLKPDSSKIVGTIKVGCSAQI
ncbi:hypothetical protein ANCDUO_06156 [Ancylostoma duodenale]|uniref:Uncharacterized protein n=1 Tax=Ancylostoma duodenale TaxID=51022 RepID=A0A0C2DLP7_9BILA|nr:hypothetical protein ANCDUO_06156 [Ancylostoma duodenale]